MPELYEITPNIQRLSAELEARGGELLYIAARMYELKLELDEYAAQQKEDIRSKDGRLFGTIIRGENQAHRREPRRSGPLRQTCFIRRIRGLETQARCFGNGRQSDFGRAVGLAVDGEYRAEGDGDFRVSAVSQAALDGFKGEVNDFRDFDRTDFPAGNSIASNL